MKDDHLQKYNPMSLSKKYAIMVTMTICTPFYKMSNFNSFTNLNLLCTIKINSMIILTKYVKYHETKISHGDEIVHLKVILVLVFQ